MPKKTEELSETIKAELAEGLRRAGIEDIDAFIAQMLVTQTMRKGELLDAIPKLTPSSVPRFTAAVVAAIVAEAITPDVGRALLYAAQVIISGSPRA